MPVSGLANFLNEKLQIILLTERALYALTGSDENETI